MLDSRINIVLEYICGQTTGALFFIAGSGTRELYIIYLE